MKVKLAPMEWRKSLDLFPERMYMSLDMVISCLHFTELQNIFQRIISDVTYKHVCSPQKNPILLIHYISSVCFIDLPM